jgi:hypothetical protein
MDFPTGNSCVVTGAFTSTLSRVPGTGRPRRETGAASEFWRRQSPRLQGDESGDLQEC